MRILYKFPSRSRPNKFFAALDNIIANAMHEDYLILATLDLDDVSMYNATELARLKEYSTRVLPVFGNSDNKVHAINRDVAIVPEWDILCLHSDDMFFTKKGFDLEIIAAMVEHFPDTDGMLHFPDQKEETRNTCTYQIIGRKYYDRQGYIYNPVFHSVFCDDEETLKAKMLGKYAFIDKQILEHRHPVWGFGQYDALLRKTQSFYRIDKRTFLKRKAENFGLNL